MILVRFPVMLMLAMYLEKRSKVNILYPIQVTYDPAVRSPKGMGIKFRPGLLGSNECHISARNAIASVVCKIY